VAVADRPGASVRATGEDPSAPVIALSGELDLASVGSVRAALDPYLTAGPTQVTLDLEHLTFMDSSGIALLVQLSNEVGTVSLTGLSPIVRRVLEATGLLEHFGLDR
jgi:anti-sigma B factor antagonist